MAQELEKVVPEVVFKDQNGNYAVNYNAIIPIVVEAMKEQQKEITQLKSRLSEIENMALACCSINSAKQQQKCPLMTCRTCIKTNLILLHRPVQLNILCMMKQKNKYLYLQLKSTGCITI